MSVIIVTVNVHALIKQCVVTVTATLCVQTLNRRNVNENNVSVGLKLQEIMVSNCISCASKWLPLIALNYNQPQGLIISPFTYTF